VLGIIPVFAGVLGIVFGTIGLNRIRRSGQRGRALAITGIVAGCFWIVAALVGVVVAVSHHATRATNGAVTQSGPVLLSDVQTGDCLSSFELSGPIRELPEVPCTSPHQFEVVDAYSMPPGGYPGLDQVRRLVRARCLDELYRYVGVSPAQAAAYDVRFIYPLASSWRIGQRTVICVGGHSDGSLLTSSIRGAGPA
jgi:hypothetical protein